MTSFDAISQEIAERGYAVIPGILDSAQLASARDALDSVMAGESKVAAEKGWRNNSYAVSYLLPQKHPFFRSIGTNPKLLPIMRHILGNDCRLANINGLNMLPGGEPQRLHIDAPQSTPGTCLYINAVHCLDDFSGANGATRLVPGSHNWRHRRGESADDKGGDAIIAEAPAGSVIAYDGALLHAGSRNTTDRPRRALHLYYRRAWALPDWDYPRSFSRSVRATMTDEEKSLFGFHDIPQIYDALTHDTTQTFPHPRWKRLARHLLRGFLR